MSIHPGYAEAILSGRKRAEFRKRPSRGSPLCQDQVRHQGQQLLVELEG